MLGELLYEEQGKTTGIRVLSSDSDGPKIEVSIQTSGKILGIEETSLWTYWSLVRPGGTLYGEGKGVMTTKDGDVVNCVGQAVGKPTGSGSAASWRGAVYFHTSSERLSKLNGIAGVFEYEVDENGNTDAKVWEWK
ncbi:MAG: hypothetical protein ACE5MK_10030 [Acidobacteriota bacterium]